MNDALTYKRASFTVFVIMNISSYLKTITAACIFTKKQRAFICHSGVSVNHWKPCISTGFQRYTKLTCLSLSLLFSLLSNVAPLLHVWVTLPLLSQWLDALLQPLVRALPTVIRDSKSFVNSIE